MHRFRRRSIALLSLPLLAGCFTVTQVPVPATAPEREAIEVRGVVVRGPGGVEERIEFETIHDATWTPTAYSVVADVDVDGAQHETITRLFPISTMSGLLVKQVDAGKTSAIIGGTFLVLAGIYAVLVSGSFWDEG